MPIELSLSDVADDSEWWLAQLKKADEAGCRADIVRATGMRRPTIDAWFDGDNPSKPGIVPGLKLLGMLGWKLVRTGADDEEEKPTTHLASNDDALKPERMKVWGQVAAGKVEELGGRTFYVDGCQSMWRASRWWDFTQGEVILLQVDGDSMSPDYPDGFLVACRAPKPGRKIPDNAPCIFHERKEGYTFKLLTYIKGKPYGQPINRRSHKLVEFRDPTDLVIQFVALGCYRADGAETA